MSHYSGTIPYTAPLYRRRTGRDCLDVSFEAIAKTERLIEILVHRMQQSEVTVRTASDCEMQTSGPQVVLESQVVGQQGGERNFGPGGDPLEFFKGFGGEDLFVSFQQRFDLGSGVPLRSRKISMPPQDFSNRLCFGTPVERAHVVSRTLYAQDAALTVTFNAAVRGRRAGGIRPRRDSRLVHRTDEFLMPWGFFSA